MIKGLALISLVNSVRKKRFVLMDQQIGSSRGGSRILSIDTFVGDLEVFTWPQELLGESDKRPVNHVNE